MRNNNYPNWHEQAVAQDAAHGTTLESYRLAEQGVENQLQASYYFLDHLSRTDQVRTSQIDASEQTGGIVTVRIKGYTTRNWVAGVRMDDEHVKTANIWTEQQFDNQYMPAGMKYMIRARSQKAGTEPEQELTSEDLDYLAIGIGMARQDWEAEQLVGEAENITRPKRFGTRIVDRFFGINRAS